MMRLSKKSLKAAVAAVLSAAVLCSASLPAFAAETAGQETDHLRNLFRPSETLQRLQRQKSGHSPLLVSGIARPVMQSRCIGSAGSDCINPDSIRHQGDGGGAGHRSNSPFRGMIGEISR